MMKSILMNSYHKSTYLSSIHRLITSSIRNSHLEHVSPISTGVFGHFIWAKIQQFALTMSNLLILVSKSIKNRKKFSFNRRSQQPIQLLLSESSTTMKFLLGLTNKIISRMYYACSALFLVFILFPWLPTNI